MVNIEDLIERPLETVMTIENSSSIFKKSPTLTTKARNNNEIKGVSFKSQLDRLKI